MHNSGQLLRKKRFLETFDTYLKEKFMKYSSGLNITAKDVCWTLAFCSGLVVFTGLVNGVFIFCSEFPVFSVKISIEFHPFMPLTLFYSKSFYTKISTIRLLSM